MSEFPRGRGRVQKHNFLKESMMLNWNFCREWGGSNVKIFQGREDMDIFSNNTLNEKDCNHYK